MNNEITGALFKQMVLHGAAAIMAQKQAINDLNVFPVPDGDTGTNMSMTIATAAAFLHGDDDLLGDLGKCGGTLGVGSALGLLNIMPFRMSGHGNYSPSTKYWMASLWEADFSMVSWGNSFSR